MLYPEVLSNAISSFKKLPGIGEKSAERYALSLLELSVKESPEDDRNMHYLGREYMYYGKWNESIDTLIKHLKLPM